MIYTWLGVSKLNFTGVAAGILITAEVGYAARWWVISHYPFVMIGLIVLVPVTYGLHILWSRGLA